MNVNRTSWLKCRGTCSQVGIAMIARIARVGRGMGEGRVSGLQASVLQGLALKGWKAQVTGPTCEQAPEESKESQGRDLYIFSSRLTHSTAPLAPLSADGLAAGSCPTLILLAVQPWNAPSPQTHSQLPDASCCPQHFATRKPSSRDAAPSDLAVLSTGAARGML